MEKAPLVQGVFWGELERPVLLTVTAKPLSQLPVKVNAELIAVFSAGLVAASEGAVLSTLKVALGPARSEVLPAASATALAATLMEMVPLPVQPLKVTEPLAVPAPPKLTVGQVAPPVVFCVMLPELKLTVFTPLPAVSLKLRVNVVELALRTIVALGAEIVTKGFV